MGAWALENFGNDDAQDFVYEAEGRHAEAVDAALTEVLAPETEYVEAHIASIALAAVEFIAAARGKPSADFPQDPPPNLEGLKPDQALIDTASKAIDQIISDSELKELWEESDEFDGWLAVQKGLKERLGLG